MYPHVWQALDHLSLFDTCLLCHIHHHTCPITASKVRRMLWTQKNTRTLHRHANTLLTWECENPKGMLIESAPTSLCMWQSVCGGGDAAQTPEEPENGLYFCLSDLHFFLEWNAQNSSLIHAPCGWMYSWCLPKNTSKKKKNPSEDNLVLLSTGDRQHRKNRKTRGIQAPAHPLTDQAAKSWISSLHSFGFNVSLQARLWHTQQKHDFNS